MNRPLRIFAASMAVAVVSSVALVSTASAEVAPVKRISCPSVAEVKKLNPDTASAPLATLKATTNSCSYYTQGNTGDDWTLDVRFEDQAATPKQAEDEIRISWPADYGTAFDPRPLSGLGAGAFWWADAGPAAVYWQMSPGAVAVMSGVWAQTNEGDDLVAIAKLFRPMMEVYTIPGERTVNGRQWRTTCESYSATARCRTDIYATVIKKTPSGYQTVKGWAFNSLTYRWSDRALWKNNPLAKTGAWTSADGRQWRSECDTPNTGNGACRSYIKTTVISRKGNTYSQNNVWVFNNQVLFNN